MSYSHLKDKQFYDDIYDHVTVMSARMDMKYFLDFRDQWFKIMPDEKPDSFRSVFHLNWIYMLMVGSDLVNRHDNRDEHIRQMMVYDEAKDELIASARLSSEPICQHCGKAGLRITDKMLNNKDGIDSPEEVLFMLNCPSCAKNTACWEDGTALEHHKTYCPKCKTLMSEKDNRKGLVITTTYTCPSCNHTHKSKLDFKAKDEKPDPDYEQDRAMYCLTDEKSLQEHRDAKRRLESMAQFGREWKEKEENKHIYDAVAEVKKPKIAELTPLLVPNLEKAGYIEFSLDKPEMGRDVFIGFSCLDSKSDREDYDSRKTLKKLVDKALIDTNWRLMTDGISYRLGYLNGRLRAYEQEEDIKKLVMQTRKLKPKQQRSDLDEKGSAFTIKDRSGKDILL